ncbi:MAG TPA: PhzF family phenazine biosynthesis protein [Flavilitoribacter sp.]|nr:PhzF family phenazine biosynthesis protein [Flavilitoribacter sp.]HMQ87783.1 PhzF family phenazine biosynthesis protein [Flavilitoribacter sp.]
MKLRQFQVDAFAARPFEGNPAAVVPLENWLPDELMQAIAMENNLAETAFFVPESEGFRLRWFTPAVEVDLCGHATLASAHILFQHLNWSQDAIPFFTRSGKLTVNRVSDRAYAMNFPADFARRVDTPPVIVTGLGVEPLEVLRGKDDYLAVLSGEEEVLNLQPDFRAIGSLSSRGLIATAPGKEVDFVSRCFFPQSGIDEDPVTGSAHTAMTPYWSAKLGKVSLKARQLSRRGGEVGCTLSGDRVILEGLAVTVLEGTLTY